MNSRLLFLPLFIFVTNPVVAMEQQPLQEKLLKQSDPILSSDETSRCCYLLKLVHRCNPFHRTTDRNTNAETSLHVQPKTQRSLSKQALKTACAKILASLNKDQEYLNGLATELDSFFRQLKNYSKASTRRTSYRENLIHSMLASVKILETFFKDDKDALEQIAILKKGLGARAIDAYLVAEILSNTLTLLQIVQKGLDAQAGLAQTPESLAQIRCAKKWCFFATAGTICLVELGHRLHWWVIPLATTLCDAFKTYWGIT